MSAQDPDDPATADAEAIAQCVSAISEAAFSASWMDGSEFQVYRLMTESGDWGRVSGAEHAALLDRARELSQRSQTWVRWDSSTLTRKRAVPLRVWQEAYARWRREWEEIEEEELRENFEVEPFEALLSQPAPAR